MSIKKFLVCTSFVFAAEVPIFADELERPEPRKDLPFPISESKHVLKKDLAKKKEGWFPTGLPLINSDPNTGIGYGLRVYMFNNGKKDNPLFEYTPYRVRFFAQYFNTTKNAQYHWVSLDVPYIADTQWRIRADFIMDFNPNTLYFGVGESSLKNLSYLEKNQPGGPYRSNSTFADQERNFTYWRPGGPGDPVELAGRDYSGFPQQPGFVVTDRMYNRYNIEIPQLNLSTERSFLGGTVRLVAGARLSKARVQTFDGKWVHAVDPTYGDFDLKAPNAKTRLTEDAEAGKILGFNGGFVNNLRIGMVYDTRDFEPDPNQGIFAEATYERSTKGIGSDFNYQKYFTQARFFYSPFPKVFEKLVLAGRFAFGVTDGDAPFFEYRNLWGTEGLITGLGGLRTLRGYKQDRFVGRAMGWGNIEVRWKFAETTAGSQHFAFNLVPFMDFGRVWDDEHKAGLKDYKYSKGLGLRVAWNQSTIIMMDYAASKEDKQLFINFSHAF
ncbi:peptide-binding protein [Leptospira perolatii]|uniref:Peptide-binding protein n=1 Tax=Leptospira perolatii TaxID=2023191 RepID=A0A2M9ZQ42_9LEPT|nr:DUF5982 domain-containing protein [Leptospira perolatii]PJZ68076.1 peptide-binding protein [Leptospira perolatii]PJZ74192.1 peptide-binding protein [Leptospira perolatii]